MIDYGICEDSYGTLLLSCYAGGELRETNLIFYPVYVVHGVVWCGVVWCGVVWCGVVWCGVVWYGEIGCDMMYVLKYGVG